MKNTIKIVHLEDNPADAELVAIELEGSFESLLIYSTSKKSEYENLLRENDVDIILSDYNVPGFDGLDSLDISREIDENVPVIFVTGELGEEIAIDILREGATDYVLKNRLEKLPLAIKRALNEVHQKKKAEHAIQALKESERKYRTIFDSFTDIYFQLNKEKKFEVVSPSVSKILGYEVKALIGENFNVFFKLQKEFKQFCYHLNKKNELRDFHFISEAKSGKRVFLSVNVSINNDSNSGTVIQGVIRDITEKKKSEILLQRTQENLLQAQRIAKIGSFRYNVKKKMMVYWSDELFRIFQFDKDEGIPDPEIFESRLVNKSKRKKISDAILYAERFLPFEQLYKYQGVDGKIRYIKEIVRPFYSEDGELNDVLGTIQDVTEQKNAQRALEFSRTRLSAILKNTSEITIIVDKDGIAKYVSPAVEQILGYSVLDVIGTEITGYVVKDQQELFSTMLQEMKEAYLSGFSSYQFETIENEKRCLRVKATNKLDNEFIQGIIISAQDITELEEAYDQLESEHNKSLRYHARLLSSQLNPHFIFNALNSIQYYILENNQEPALHYLSSFAGLMRQTLNNSKSDYLSLKDEIEFLNNYLLLEESRFRNKFKYTINCSDEIDPEDLFVPPMFLQPHVENAIIHGISNLKSEGRLDVDFFLKKEQLICRIRDNGIGREKAKELKNLRSGSEYKSMAMSLTTTRLNILNQLEDESFNVLVKDLVDPEGSAAGTEVTIEMPVIMDV